MFVLSHLLSGKTYLAASVGTFHSPVFPRQKYGLRSSSKWNAAQACHVNEKKKKKRTRTKTPPQLLTHTAESNVMQAKVELLTLLFRACYLKCGLWTSTIHTALGVSGNCRKSQDHFSPSPSQSAQRFFMPGLGLECGIFNKLLGDSGTDGPESRLLAARFCFTG